MKRKKPKKMLDVLMIGLLIFGIGLFLYPFCGEVIANFADQQLINYYQNKTNRESAQQTQERLAEMQAENEKLATGANNPGSDPFATAETEEAIQEGYFESHTIGIIRIPKINVKLPIFDRTNESFLKRGSSLLEGTSYPTGGTSTHAVISAHRGLPEGKLFTDLPELTVGDQFYIEIGNEVLAYEVDQIKTVEPTETSDLLIESGADQVTLMTCTPYMINSHRLLVRGKRIPYEETMSEQLAKSDQKRLYSTFGLAAMILLVVLVTVGFVIRQLRRKTATGK